MKNIKKADEEWLKRAIDDVFKKVKRAEWELDHKSQELREKFHSLYHYLDYLKRFCESKA